VATSLGEVYFSPWKLPSPDASILIEPQRVGFAGDWKLVNAWAAFHSKLIFRLMGRPAPDKHPGATEIRKYYFSGFPQESIRDIQIPGASVTQPGIGTIRA